MDIEKEKGPRWRDVAEEVGGGGGDREEAFE
jgi:hypothetical protein